MSVINKLHLKLCNKMHRSGPTSHKAVNISLQVQHLVCQSTSYFFGPFSKYLKNVRLSCKEQFKKVHVITIRVM